VHENVLRKWVKQLADDPLEAFPGHGTMKAAEAEIERLKREVQKIKTERDIPKKSRGLLRQGPGVMFAFMAKHRGIWPLTTICEALGVSRSGFYGWLSRPSSERANRHEALVVEIRKSFRRWRASSPRSRPNARQTRPIGRATAARADVFDYIERL